MYVRCRVALGPVLLDTSTEPLLSVRFTPKSGHARRRHRHPLSANSGHARGAKRRQILRKAQHLIIKWKLVFVRTSKSSLIYVNLAAGEQRLLVFKHALPYEAGEYIG